MPELSLSEQLKTQLPPAPHRGNLPILTISLLAYCTQEVVGGGSQWLLSISYLARSLWELSTFTSYSSPRSPALCPSIYQARLPSLGTSLGFLMWPLSSQTPLPSCRTESPAWLSSAPLLLQGALNWHEADHSTGIFPDWFLNAGSHQLYPARAGTRMSKQVLRKHVMTGPQRAGRPGLTKHNDQHRTFAYNHVCAHPCTL